MRRAALHGRGSNPHSSDHATCCPSWARLKPALLGSCDVLPFMGEAQTRTPRIMRRAGLHGRGSNPHSSDHATCWPSWARLKPALFGSCDVLAFMGEAQTRTLRIMR